MSQSKHTVGRKIVRYLTSHRRRVSQGWYVVHHQVIAELHATKGWRVVDRQAKVHSVKKLPSRSQWLAAFLAVFVWEHKIPGINPKWARPDFFLGRDAALLKARLRHRERRRDFQLEEYAL